MEREIQKMESFFYVDDSLIASTWPECLQGVFDILTEIFDWVGLRKNMVKTVGMV